MKKFALILSVVFLVAGMFSIFMNGVAMAADDDWEDLDFTDYRDNRILIPGGAKSCVTEVVDFIPGTPWTSDPRAMDPLKIIGAPDYDYYNDENYVTLGKHGVIVLKFDVCIYDGPGKDIYVFEIGPDVEATRVEVSEDGVNWIYVGDAEGSLSGVDMHGKVPADGKYMYVKLTDRDGIGYSWPGADVDAVAAVNVKLPDGTIPGTAGEFFKELEASPSDVVDSQTGIFSDLFFEGWNFSIPAGVTSEQLTFAIYTGKNISSSEAAHATAVHAAGEKPVFILTDPDGKTKEARGDPRDEPVVFHAENKPGTWTVKCSDAGAIPEAQLTRGMSLAGKFGTASGIATLKVRFQGRTAPEANIENLTVKWIKGGKVIETQEPVTTDDKGTAGITLP